MHRLLLVCSCIASLCLPLCAELEKWTRADGKTAELDLVNVRGTDEDAELEFLTKPGKKVILKLNQLANEDQARAKAWTPGGIVRVDFVKAHGDMVDGKSRTIFDFQVKGKGLLDLVCKEEASGVVRPGEPVVIKFASGEKSVDFEQCYGWLDQSRFEKAGDEDPFAKSSEAPVEIPDLDDPLNLSLTLEGTPGDLQSANCVFEAKVVFRHVSKPVDIEAMIDVSKKLDNLHYQQLGPFKVALQPWVESDDSIETQAEALAKRGPQGYSVEFEKGTDPELLLAKNIVINGKNSGDVLVEAKGPRLKVALKYWSVVREVPVIVRKKPDDSGQ